MVDSVYWIWFQLVFGIGSRRSEWMLGYFEDPKEIYDGAAADGRVSGMLKPAERKAVGQAMENARAIQMRTRKKGVDILTPDHPDYPARLQTIYAKPAVLYVKGDLACLKESLAIAMVGTRSYTEYGKKAARLLAGELAAAGVVVVSGLARGIDTHCHEAALEAGGKTIGVLGCGIDVDYPSGSAAVKRAMSRSGAVVTEYPLGIATRPANFPLRNRILSGMCSGVVVVEADRKSGSIITANHALEQGRDVFAVPGSIFSRRGQGTHALLREGAHLVESAEDILSLYGLDVPIRQVLASPDGDNLPAGQADGEIRGKREPPAPPIAKREKPPAPEGLSDTGRLVYNRIDGDPVPVERIAGQIDAPMGDILAALTELELFGLIQGYPGRRFGIYWD